MATGSPDKNGIHKNDSVNLSDRQIKQFNTTTLKTKTSWKN